MTRPRREAAQVFAILLFVILIGVIVGGLSGFIVSLVGQNERPRWVCIPAVPAMVAMMADSVGETEVDIILHPVGVRPVYLSTVETIQWPTDLALCTPYSPSSPSGPARRGSDSLPTGFDHALKPAPGIERGTVPSFK